MPSGTAIVMAATSDTMTRKRCSRVVRKNRRIIRPYSRIPVDGRDRDRRIDRASQEGGGHKGLGLVVDTDLGVQPRHGRGIDPPLQAMNRFDQGRGTLLEIGTIEDHGMVGGEVVKVVFQHAETVDNNLGVGRVDVSHVEFAGAQAAVGQGMIDDLQIFLRQIVAGPGDPPSRPSAP